MMHNLEDKIINWMVLKYDYYYIKFYFGGFMSTFNFWSGGLCPPLIFGRGGLCPPWFFDRGVYVQVGQKSSGGLCPGGVMSVHLVRYVHPDMYNVSSTGPMTLCQKLRSHLEVNGHNFVIYILSGPLLHKLLLYLHETW